MAITEGETKLNLSLEHVSGNTETEETNFMEAYRALRELQELRRDPLRSLMIDNGQEFYECHRKLAESGVFPSTPATYGENGETIVEKAYWEIPHVEGELFTFTFGSQRVESGPLSAFPLGTRALVVDTAARIYGDKLLKLDKWAERVFPSDPEMAAKWRLNMEIQLLTTMSHEFRPDHLTGVVYENRYENPIVIGSIGAVHGRGERLVADTIGHDGILAGPSSSLPSNFAMRYNLDPRVRQNLRRIAEVQTTEITRLWRVNPPDGVDTSWVTLALYTSLAMAISENTPEVEYLLFNTRKGLSEMIKAAGYPVEHAATGEVWPTLGIMSTIHGRYYAQAARSNGLSQEHIAIPQFLNFPKAKQRSEELISEHFAQKKSLKMTSSEFFRRIDAREAEQITGRHPEVVLLDDDEEIVEVTDRLLNAHPEAKCINLSDLTFASLVEKKYPGEWGNTPSEDRARLVEGKRDLLVEGRKFGAVVYLPLSNEIVAYPPEEVLYEARTITNRGLTTPEQQGKLKAAKLGIVGLSTGMAQALSLNALGIGGIRGRDMDPLTANSLNRVPVPAAFMGAMKADIAEHMLLQSDPYRDHDFKPEAVAEGNIDKFLEGLDVVIDACDDPDIKYLLRKKALELGIDVVMLGNMSETRVIVDVERYSTGEGKIFHGALEQLGISEENWDKLLDLQKHAIIVGPQNTPLSMLQSIPDIVSGGLPGFPQEASSVMAGGGITSYVVKRLVLGQPVPARTIIDFDSQLEDPTVYALEQGEAQKMATAIAQNLGIPIK